MCPNTQLLFHISGMTRRLQQSQTRTLRWRLALITAIHREPEKPTNQRLQHEMQPTYSSTTAIYQRNQCDASNCRAEICRNSPPRKQDLRSKANSWKMTTKPATRHLAMSTIGSLTSFPPTNCFGLATACSTTSSDSYVMKMNARLWFFTRSNGCSTSTICR